MGNNKKIKKSVNIPVIGNGDIKSKEDAKRMFMQTGVDGIMIGRAAIGKPWIFEEIINYLSEKEQRVISNDEKLSIILEHIKLAVEEKGEKIAIKEMRKHLAYYIRNGKDASKLREKINKIEERVELENCLKQYFN